MRTLSRRPVSHEEGTYGSLCRNAAMPYSASSPPPLPGRRVQQHPVHVGSCFCSARHDKHPFRFLALLSPLTYLSYRYLLLPPSGFASALCTPAKPGSSALTTHPLVARDAGRLQRWAELLLRVVHPAELQQQVG